MEYSTEYSMEYKNQENGIFHKICKTCLNATFLKYGIFQEYSKKKVHNGNVEFLEYGISQEYSKIRFSMQN